MAALQGQPGKPRESSHEALAGTEAEDHPKTLDTQVPSDKRATSPRTSPMMTIPNGDTQATVPTQTCVTLNNPRCRAIATNRPIKGPHRGSYSHGSNRFWEEHLHIIISGPRREGWTWFRV